MVAVSQGPRLTCLSGFGNLTSGGRYDEGETVGGGEGHRKGHRLAILGGRLEDTNVQEEEDTFVHS